MDLLAGDILAMVDMVATVVTVTWGMGKVMVLAMAEDMAVAMAATLLPVTTVVTPQPTPVATLHPLQQVTLMLPMA